MLGNFDVMLWSCLLLEIEIKGFMVWYTLLGDWTKTSQYKREFHTFQNKMIRSQSFSLICNINIHFFKNKSILNRVQTMLCAMVCCGMNDEYESMKMHVRVWDFNAMVWDWNVMLFYFVCCKIYI